MDAGIKLSSMFELAYSNTTIKEEIDPLDNGSKFMISFAYEKKN